MNKKIYKDNRICFLEHPCFFVIILLFFFAGSSCLAMDKPPKKRVVGGQCDYKKYKGQATIVSIGKKELKEKYRGPSYESYEVKFSFHADEIIKEKHGQVEGREYLLLLKNSRHPGPKFLHKYGIEEGKVFDCYLNVIIRGTCTPVMFDFPTIDLGDYFENP
ncbi:MAG: hypothetical protein JRI22_22530 [Deltaproteobacteria bacterium]|nr:hypothetical protein [Deltaproteobacteria bacterium]